MKETEKRNSNDSDFEYLISLLRKRGVTFVKGLSDKEITEIENEFRFIFPPDLRQFLQTALPVSNNFIDWHSIKDIKQRFDWPFEGILFDISNNHFWYKDWGQKPDSQAKQIQLAESFYKQYPPLIPIYSHRYLPATPCEAGNPVFSVYQTDIICYGNDLFSYFSNEFGIKYDNAVTQQATPRYIEFWSDLAD